LIRLNENDNVVDHHNDWCGAAGVAGGSGGVFHDFVEFLENNVDGYTSAGSSGGVAVLMTMPN
jgi:hypothetical protein